MCCRLSHSKHEQHTFIHYCNTALKNELCSKLPLVNMIKEGSAKYICFIHLIFHFQRKKLKKSIQWGKYVFDTLPIFQGFPLTKNGVICNLKTSVKSNLCKKENHIVCFLNNELPFYSMRHVFDHLHNSGSHRPVSLSLRSSPILHSLPVLIAPV